jgi:hypothetical protein
MEERKRQALRHHLQPTKKAARGVRDQREGGRGGAGERIPPS